MSELAVDQVPLTLAEAGTVWQCLRERWKLGPNEILVGSARRQRPQVNDLEFVSPWPEHYAEMTARQMEKEPACDSLFCTINRHVENPWKGEQDGLFAHAGAAAAIPGPVVPETKRIPCRAIRGLKPGFRALSLEVKCWERWVPLQIFRAERAGFGWLLLDRTGPREFGMWFLGQWKKTFGIPYGDENRPASDKGLLRDHEGGVIAVDNEGDLFVKIGVPYVPPQDRDAFGEKLKAKYEGGRR